MSSIEYVHSREDHERGSPSVPSAVPGESIHVAGEEEMGEADDGRDAKEGDPLCGPLGSGERRPSNPIVGKQMCALCAWRVLR